MLRSRAHARGVSKHEGKGIARLILRDGATRLLRMRLPKTAARTALVGPFPVFSCFFANTDLGFTRDRRPNVRKSGKPDLRGPLRPVAVPDQRCTLADARAASRPRHAIATAGFLIADSLVKQPISFPRPHFCVRALPLCFTHPPSRGGRSAERRSGVCETPVGVHVTRHARRLARRLASHDAGRSPLGAPPWRFSAPGPRFSVTGTCLR
jgi:hypothetical protein